MNCESISHEPRDDDKLVRRYRVHEETGEFACTAEYCDACASELQECGNDIRVIIMRSQRMNRQ